MAKTFIHINLTRELSNVTNITETNRLQFMKIHKPWQPQQQCQEAPLQ